MKTIIKTGMVVACTSLFLGLAVLGVNIKIETKPATVSAAEQCTDTYQYTTTLASTSHWDANGTYTGSAVSCSAPGAGWTSVDNECLISSASCDSKVCLWKKPATQNLSYVMTHHGTVYNLPAINCANSAPAGYTLKSRGCAATGVNGCISDVCLWEKPNTTAVKNDLLLSHAGAGVYDSVNCSTSSPASGYGLNSRIGILSYTTNIYSDLCLWQKSQTCEATVACNTNADCGTNGFTGTLTCQNNDVYQSYKTYTCNNPGTATSYCSNASVSQLKQMCAASQACSTGGCFPETW